MTAINTSWDWLNLPEKSKPANTKTFLIHSFGRPVLIAARSGERRGTTGSSAAVGRGSEGTVGCSEVMVSKTDSDEGCRAKLATGRERVAPAAPGMTGLHRFR